MAFDSSLTAVKAQGLDLLKDAKTFLEAVVKKVSGDAQADLPTFSTDAVTEALSFVANPLAHDFIHGILDTSKIVPAADAAVSAAIGAGLLRLEAVIASI